MYCLGVETEMGPLARVAGVAEPAGSSGSVLSVAVTVGVFHFSLVGNLRMYVNSSDT